MSTATKTNRQYYLDIARTIAILAISLNHAVNRSFEIYRTPMMNSQSMHNLYIILDAVFSFLSRLGVPIFLMITGVLILNKPINSVDDIKKFYKRNLLPLFITTEIWFVLQYWFIVLFNSKVTVLQDQGVWGAVFGMFKTMLFQDQVLFGSMWYMPMILCVYTTIPFVSLLINKLKDDKKCKLLFLPVILVYINDMVLPTVNYLLSRAGVQPLQSEISGSNLISFYYVYIIVGFLIGKGILSKWKTKYVVFATLISFSVSCVYVWYAFSNFDSDAFNYDSPILPVCGALLFELIRRVSGYLKRIEKPITYLSRISFAIYLIHMVFISSINRLFGDYMPNPIVEMAFVHISSLVISVAVITVLSKIKLLKKYLFMIK